MVLLREVHKYWIMHTRRTCEFGLHLPSPMLSLSTLLKLKMDGCSFLLLLSTVLYSPGGQRVSLSSTQASVSKVGTIMLPLSTCSFEKGFNYHVPV